MNCSTRMSSLEPPLTTIFGVMFMSISVFASVTNGFVLFVLWKPGGKVTSSTKILTSLAVSDFLVGMILSPLTSWQVLSKSLNDCRVEYTRRYLVLLLTGSSVLTLGLISYDRYILLLKLSNYSKYMTRWKLITFLLFPWLVPALIPILQLEIFGSFPYLIAVILIFFCPLVVLIVNYRLILRVIKRQEKTLRTYELEVSGATSVTDTSRGTIQNSFKEIAATEKKKRKARKQITQAKSVIMLIFWYILCLMPSNAWIVVRLINLKYHFLSLKVFHVWYLIAAVTTLLNSCLNPVIYFLKNPEFRKRAKASIQRRVNSN